MKNKLLKKSLSILLALLMIFSLLPATAFAEEGVNVDIIVAKGSYDGWEILHPDSIVTTQVKVPYEGANPTAIDAVKALDSGFDGKLTSNRPTTFFGYSRATNGYGNWMMLRKTESGSSFSNVANFNNAIADGDSIIIYLPFSDGSSGMPTWDALFPLITNPIQRLTQAERLEKLLYENLTFDKIKGSNTAADSVTANLGSLPGYLDGTTSSFANISVSWVSSNTLYMSNSGTLQVRPKYGDAPVNVTMTATANIGGSYNADKYGEYPDLPKDIPIELTILPLTEEEETGKASEVSDIAAALDLLPSNLKYLDNTACAADNVLRSIWLNTSSLAGVSGVNAVWTSGNTDIIRINSAQGIVVRPALGEPDATVTLTVIAYKNQYSERKSFEVIVPAVTQAELDAVNAELDTVASALTFDVIKNANTSADAVRTSLQMVYRGLGYPNEITWSTSNSGYAGVEIAWETSDSTAIAYYGTVTRPATADKSVIMTATLKPFQLETYVNPRIIEIPMVVRKVSNSAAVANITASPSMGLTFDALTKEYYLTAPAIADSVEITVKTAESGTLITSGENKARGALTFEVNLITDNPVSVIIDTQSLDMPANTDRYTLNITRETPSDVDTAVSELLESISTTLEGTSDAWSAMDMSAYGKADSVAGKTIIENARTEYINGSMTDLEREIVALTALGVNAGKVYAGEQFTDDYLDFVAKVCGNYSISRATEAIFGLIALDSGDYDDSGLVQTRQSYIDYLLNHKLTPAAEQTAWSIASGNNNPDIDITAMAVVALAPYYDDSVVKTTIDGALRYLSEQQGNSGHYGNSNSTAMVVVALAALGENPHTNVDFIKNGKSLIDGLLSFKTEDNRFGNTSSESASKLSTEQGFRALVAYRGLLYAGGGAYNIYQFGAQTGDGTALTGENNPGNGSVDPNAPITMTVRAENLFTGTTLIQETIVTLNGTHLDALKEALRVNGKNPDTALTGTGFITSLLGVSQEGSKGWMFALNGRVPSTTLTETKAAAGDSLVLFYVDYGPSYNEPFYLSKFDKTTAKVTAGESVALTLTGSFVDIWSLEANPYNPVSGATVYAYDDSGIQVGSSVTTGVDGKATISFTKAGTYTISAKRAGSLNATDIVPPFCKVTVSNGSTPPGSTDISVNFMLKGDVANPVAGKVYVYRLNPGAFKTLIPTTTITAPQGSTVNYVFEKALNAKGISYDNSGGTYVTDIDGLRELDRGDKSGWLYMVNGKYPNKGIDDYVLKSGDDILFHYTYDYTQEEVPVSWGRGSSATTTSGAITITKGAVALSKGLFEDVKGTDPGKHWAADAIYSLAGMQIINGTEAGGLHYFYPNNNITRAEFTAFAVRALALPQDEKSSFSDVTANKWYSEVVAAGAKAGIISGTGDNKFTPDALITREEAMIIMRNIMKYKEKDAKIAEDEIEKALEKFADKDAFSSWAKEAGAVSAREGIINGDTKGNANPKAFMTRAEAAQMLYNLLEKLK